MWSSCRVKKCGWLMKQSGVMKTWNRRWFILSDDGRLSYYKSPADWSNQGVTVDLATCSAVQDRVAFGAKGLSVDWPSGVLKECCFVVSTRGRTLYMYATAKEECSAWLVTLQHAMIKAMNDAKERGPSLPSFIEGSTDTLVRERTKSTSSFENKIDKLRRRFSTVGRPTASSLAEKDGPVEMASDNSEGDSLSVHSSYSGGNILDDDRRSMASFISSTSNSTVATNASSTSGAGRQATGRGDTVVSWQNTKLSYGLSKNRLPASIAQDVQDSLIPLVRAMGSINGATGFAYSFLCNFGEVYKAVSWHLTGAGKQAAADKEKLGTIIHEKYLIPLSQCIVEMCEDSEQKQTFVQRTWKRLVEFQCGQSPFQDSGCHAADWWLDSGILHVAVLAQYFGEVPFQPLPLSIPEVNGANQPALMPSLDSGVASSGDYLSRTSSHEKTLSYAEDAIPESLREDISKSTQLLHVALQVISDITKVPFTFECEFRALCKLVDSSLHSRLASIVYNDYLMATSANIVDYCEDKSCREEFVRNVHSRRIVLVVDDEEQLVKSWGYLVPSGPAAETTARQWPGTRSITDDIDATNQHGGQVVCREGVLYLTVPLEVFSKIEFNPSMDVFEARRPKDECSRLNNYISSHAGSGSLPVELRTDITNAARFLEKALESASKRLKLDLVLECNFDTLFRHLSSAQASQDELHGMATTLFRYYITVLCRSLMKYVEEVSERTSLLERHVYNQKISFMFVTEDTMSTLLNCPQQHSLGGASSRPGTGSICPSHTFLHRGVVRIVCLPAYFGKCNYSADVESLAQIPDNMRIRSTFRQPA